MQPKILVVDDSEDVLFLCRVHLSYEGYDVVTATDGLTALERVAADRPDLVLLDVMMPGTDGWSVLRTLKDDPASADIPVVMLTAREERPARMRGYNGGAVGFVTKPFNPLTLTSTVRTALSRPSDEQEDRRRRIVEMLELDERVGTPTRDARD